MPTMGLLSLTPPIDPWNPALPKVNTPPSEATVQYPWPLAPDRVMVGAMPTMGCASLIPPIDPSKPRPPKANIPPSDATVQYDGTLWVAPGVVPLCRGAGVLDAAGAPDTPTTTRAATDNATSTRPGRARLCARRGMEWRLRSLLRGGAWPRLQGECRVRGSSPFS